VHPRGEDIDNHPATGAKAKDGDRLERIKQNAIAFYSMAYEGNPRKAVDLYVGDTYTQHNPVVGDGSEGFIAYFEKMAQDYANKSIEFARSVAEGDLVALHTHQLWPDGDQYVTMDFFRFDENDRIIEHWDSIQSIPATSENDNGMV
jgi:predicted SnoaL-like aldol condensation-catalyzing enzyme